MVVLEARVAVCATLVSKGRRAKRGRLQSCMLAPGERRKNRRGEMAVTRALLVAGMLALAVMPVSANSGCLELMRVWSFDVLNNRTLIVEDELHEKFKLDLMGYCPALPFKETLGFKVIGGTGLTCISKGDEVISHDIGKRYDCPISNIQPYTPAMESADKAAASAKAAPR
jgi:hypothetical protein